MQVLGSFAHKIALGGICCSLISDPNTKYGFLFLKKPYILLSFSQAKADPSLAPARFYVNSHQPSTEAFYEGTSELVFTSYLVRLVDEKRTAQ